MVNSRLNRKKKKRKRKKEQKKKKRLEVGKLFMQKYLREEYRDLAVIWIKRKED